MIVITSRVTAVPGGRDALIAAFDPLHAAVADEPGTVIFAMHEADENGLFFYEVYRDEAALAAHRDSAAVRDLVGRLDRDHVVGRPVPVLDLERVSGPSSRFDHGHNEQ